LKTLFTEYHYIQEMILALLVLFADKGSSFNRVISVKRKEVLEQKTAKEGKGGRDV